MDTMTLLQKLQAVQFAMKAPKNLYNSFGKYNYRNAESILEAFKPYGKEYGLALIVSDEVVEIGGRVYVKASAMLYDVNDGAQHIENTAYARESDEKKGMDASQITGTASSYARKYALNGLFLLDDTKDADSDEYHRQTTEQPKKSEKVNEANAKQRVMAYVNKSGMSKEEIDKLCGAYKVKEISEMTLQHCNHYIDFVRKNGGEI